METANQSEIERNLTHFESKMGEYVWWRFEGADKYRCAKVLKVNRTTKRVYLRAKADTYIDWFDVLGLEIAGLCNPT